MPNKLEATMELILKKKFNKRIHSGYDPEDVDLFFDEVIEFLKESNRTILANDSHVKTLENEIRSLREQIEQKNNVISSQTQEINYYKENGYSTIRAQKQMMEMREEIAKLKETKNK